MIIMDCLNQAHTIHLAKFLFDLRTESDLTLLPDAGHVLTQTSGEDAAKMTSDPMKNLVPGLVEVVDTDSSLGELPPPSPHPLKQARSG